MNQINAKAMAVIRIAASAVATINLVLAAKGKSPIPFDEESVQMATALVLQGAAALWTWWKNNDLTEEAALGTGLTRLLKAQKKDNDEIYTEPEDLGEPVDAEEEEDHE